MTTPAPLKKDPMKAFRGIMAGTLILEVIVVALALPVIAKLHGGVTSAAGWVAFGFIALFIAMCAFVRKPWAIAAVVGLHVLLIASWILLPAMGVIGGCTDTNEVNYLLVKAFRAGLGVIPIEQQARI